MNRIKIFLIIPFLVLLSGCGVNDWLYEIEDESDNTITCEAPNELKDGECKEPSDDVEDECVAPNELINGECKEPEPEEAACDIYLFEFFCDGNTYSKYDYSRLMLQFIFEKWQEGATDEFCEVFFEDDLQTKCETDISDFYPFIYGQNPATYQIALNNDTGYFEFTISDSVSDTEYKVSFDVIDNGENPVVSVWQLEIIDDLGIEITREMVEERFSGFFDSYNNGSYSCSEYSTIDSQIRDACIEFFTSMTTLTIDEIIVKDVGFGSFLIIPLHLFDTPVGFKPVYNPVVITPEFEGLKLKIDTYFYPNPVYLQTARLAGLNFDDIALNSNLSDEDFSQRVGLELEDAIQLRTAILNDIDSYTFELNQVDSIEGIPQFHMIISADNQIFTYNVYVSIGWGETTEIVLMTKVETN